METGYILSKLKSVEKHGDYWMARCPAHDDNNPSLQIKETNEKTSLTCYAGCSIESICNGVGITVADLYKQPLKKSKQTNKPNDFVETDRYYYHNETGEIEYYIKRECSESTNKKSFLAFHTINDREVVGLGKKRKLPYKLPSLLDAVKQGKTVFLVEGEKDVNTLGKIGLIATTNPFGAGKWTDDLSQYLKGAKVILIPDNDEPGYKHTFQVYNSLGGTAGSTKIVLLPNTILKSDVSDYLQTHTKEELIELCNSFSDSNIDDLLPLLPAEKKNKQQLVNSETGELFNHIFWQETPTVKDPKEAKDFKLSIVLTKLYEYIDSLGYCLLKYDKSEIIVKVENNIVTEQLSLSQLRQDVFNYISSLPKQISENFTKDTLKEVYLKQQNNLILLSNLQSTAKRINADQFVKDGETTSFVFYQNWFLEVTKDGIKTKDYKDLTGYVWNTQIINRNFTLIDDIEKIEQFDFYKFCKNICTDKDREENGIPYLDKERFTALACAIGYLLHTYNNPSKPWAVILNEANIEETRQGGTGKGIIGESIGKIRNGVLENGENWRDGTFRFQQINYDTNFCFLQDIRKNFNFENLFSALTDGLTIEKKREHRFHIPFEKAPKFLISTNFAIIGTDGSFNRRKKEIEIYTYYGEEHKPIDDFGKLFFSGWNADEWNLFDNFMIGCLESYLDAGDIPKFKSETLERKRIVVSTNEEFLDWITEKFDFSDGNEIEFEISSFYENYKVFASIKDDSKFSKQKLTSWIKIYCKFKNYDYESVRTGIERRHKITRKVTKDSK